MFQTAWLHKTKLCLNYHLFQMTIKIYLYPYPNRKHKKMTLFRTYRAVINNLLPVLITSAVYNEVITSSQCLRKTSSPLYSEWSCGRFTLLLFIVLQCLRNSLTQMDFQKAGTCMFSSRMRRPMLFFAEINIPAHYLHLVNGCFFNYGCF